MTLPRIALIFGISGQDGAYLAHLLLSKGYEVHGVSRDAGVTSFDRLVRLGVRNRVTLHTGNLDEFGIIVELMTKVRPDEIYNLSGQSSVALSFELPVATFNSVAVGTLSLLEYLRIVKQPARLFQAVSTECFGSTGKIMTETDAFRPRSPYAVAKAASFWASSLYREAYGVHVCCGILSNHESPLRPRRFVTSKVVRAAVDIARGQGERLSLGNVSIERDWGWAPEYVDAMWRILQHDEPGDYIIATGETRPLSHLVASVFACLGLNWRDHVDIDETLFRPAELDRVELDPSRARERLGWSAQSRMQAMVNHLVKDAMTHTLGPVPWADGTLPDLGGAASTDPESRGEPAMRPVRPRLVS